MTWAWLKPLAALAIEYAARWGRKKLQPHPDRIPAGEIDAANSLIETIKPHGKSKGGVQPKA